MAKRGPGIRSVCIVPANYRDASYVAANMRSEDRREFDALVDMSAPGVVACDLVYRSEGLAYCALIGGQPVAVYGACPILPHLWSAWAYGTDRLKRAIPAITRHALAVAKPALIERQITRLQVNTLVDHDLSHSWLESLGARCEGVARCYGRHGEDFKVYAWTKRD